MKWALIRNGPSWLLPRAVAVGVPTYYHWLCSGCSLTTSFSSSVQGALEWLEANQDKSLEEIKAESKNDDEEEGPQLQPGEEARSLVCNECGKKFRSHAQAEFHASKSQHVDFSESTEELKPLTEEEKKAKLEDLRQKLAAKRSVQSVQDKIDQKRNEVNAIPFTTFEGISTNHFATRKSGERARKNPKTRKRSSRGSK